MPHRLIALSAALFVLVAPRDEVQLRDSTLFVEPGYAEVMLPPAWASVRDSIQTSAGCGRWVHGPFSRRMAVTRPMLDSVRNARGEWDREYSAVVDSILPFEGLLAQLGPEPFGGGHCFADLQMRVYVTSLDPAIIRSNATSAGVATANRFFPLASIASRDSASWHIDHVRWDARYFDYGADANVELYSTRINGRTLTLVFMRSSWSPTNAAAEDQNYVMQHVKIGS